MANTAWYFRLFYIPIINLAVCMLLYKMIKAKRMISTGSNTFWMVVYFLELGIYCVVMWFVPFSINVAFWIGISIIVFGQVVFSLGYMAMREHPEKKGAVVDWGIYKVSRNSHVVAGKITTLGAIVMGWNVNSILYIVLWAYFVFTIMVMHYGILNEEKINSEKFGHEYTDYMKRVPRYLFDFLRIHQ